MPAEGPAFSVSPAVLRANDDTIRNRFALLETRRDVARLLEVKLRFLAWVLYVRRERKNYRSFSIPKSRGGVRHISAPPKNLSILQIKLARVLQIVFDRKPSAHGFIRGQSILTNAKPHVGQRVVLNIDLADFFPTIHVGRIAATLQAEPYSVGERAAMTLAQICCMDCGRLPQGGPTSPMISNIVCRSLDTSLQRLASQTRCVYTRYADDITFSTTAPLISNKLAVVASDGAVSAGELLRKVIEKHNFEINRSKVRLSNRWQRQEVTGLTVNEFPNVSRKFIRTLRAMIHNWDRKGATAAAQEYSRYSGRSNTSEDTFKRVVRGNLEFIRMIRGSDAPVYRRLQARAHFIDSVTVPRKPMHVRELASTPLRGISVQPEPWTRIVERYRGSICLLEVQVGEDLTGGTAFYFGNHLFATAGHCIAGREEEDTKVKPYPLTLEDPFDPAIRPTAVAWKHVQHGVDFGLIRVNDRRMERLSRLPTQYRLPKIGEEVMALGFPTLLNRKEALVAIIGTVTALSTSPVTKERFIQLSVVSSVGISGGPVVDRRGLVIGIMIENVSTQETNTRPATQYAQALPISYRHHLKHDDFVSVPE